MKSIFNAKLAAIEFMNTFHPNREWWVVGGMLRDTDQGREFKDIDIFIAGFPNDLLPEGDVDDGDKNAFLLRAYTVKDYPYRGDPYEINLIFMRGADWSLERMADRCDFGICQIGWCPKTGRTYRSDAYNQDRDYRTLTLTRETSQERIRRMELKFPMHGLRNPDHIAVDGKKRWTYDEDTGKLVITYDKLNPKTMAQMLPRKEPAAYAGV